MNKDILEEQIQLNKSIRQIAISLETSPTNIRYWLKKYDLKTNKNISTFTKICPCCKQEKLLDQFYTRRENKTSSYCKECTNTQTIKRQQNLKQQALNYKGNKCISCGYNKYPGALEFHHLDPKEKDFSLSHVKLYKFTDKIKEELDKCILLCSNCHREIHANLIKFDEKIQTIITLSN